MKRLWLLAPAACVFGCSETLRPSEVAGDYQLAAVDGAPPPQTVRERSGCRYTVEAGTLTIGQAGAFTLTLGERAECVAPASSGNIATVWTGTYAIDGDVVVLTATKDDVVVHYRARATDDRIAVPMGADYGTIAFDRMP